MNVFITIIDAIYGGLFAKPTYEVLMEDFEDKKSYLLLDTQVRRLRKGKVTARFLNLSEEIRRFYEI
jgi:hypothetical protein